MSVAGHANADRAGAGRRGADRAADVFAQVAPDGFEVIPCPACGEKLSTVAYQGKDWVIDQRVTLTIVRCDRCGLHYHNPRPRLELLGRWYPDEYHCYQKSPSQAGERDVRGDSIGALVLRDAYGAPSVKPTGHKRRLARAVRLVRGADHFGAGVPYRGQGRLLDFGCGEGKFVRRMAGLGWDVTGLDFGQAAVDAVKAGGIKALLGSLPHPEVAPASFDVITMRQALEHVPDPNGVLRAACEALAPGGLLVVEVPNFASWEARYFGDASYLIDLPRHLLHFTPPTLKALLVSAGFPKVRVWQVGRSSWTRKAAARADRRPRRAADKLLRSSLACRVVARWTQLTGQGNEIIAWAEKASP